LAALMTAGLVCSFAATIRDIYRHAHETEGAS
jgi:hypothetical protein